MEGNLTPRTFIMLLFSITLGSFGQLCLKTGLKAGDLGKHSHSLIETFTRILVAMWNPYVLLGLGLYIISTFTWLLLLSKVRLSVAYPMISISYIFVVVLSSLILPNEHVAWHYAIPGLLFISAGVSFIGLGLGRMAHAPESGTQEEAIRG